MFVRLKKFFSNDLWLLEEDSSSRLRAGLYRQLQLTVYVWREFWRDNCLLRASGLTYTTLLTLVPLLALMFAILKGLGIQRALQPFILERLTGGSHAIAERILVYVDRINVGSLGTLGITFLFITMILVLTNVEMAFNQIWKVGRGRPWLRKCSDYLGLLVILPVSIFATMSLTTFVKNHSVTRELISIGVFGHLYVYLLKFAPFLVMWLAFSFIYLFMPNTRVNPVSASTGGIIGGTLWQLSQWAYIHYQFAFHNWSAVYGALSQLPMLLIWIFLSWVILLLGAEVAFAHQNFATFRLQQRWSSEPLTNKTYWGLRLLLCVGERFQQGKSPLTDLELAETLHLPPQEARSLVETLEHLGALSCSGENGRVVLPAKDMRHLKLFELVEGLEGKGGSPAPAAADGHGKVVADILNRIRDQGRRGVEGLSVADLLDLRNSSAEREGLAAKKTPL
ncbi:MAG: YihY/virulence factor BrkB family protein [Deltaproteobacteria bacterium]|nr:YihY/virulence factor BrkB family protein [Deltaproteobacteria bacterium]MBW2070167.1 YihY/virulence factor BrkB family protein [Deltaproteobacteria bacterium]